MNLSKLWERLKDRRAWYAAVYSVVKSQTNSATEQQHRLGSLSKLGKSRAGGVDKAYLKSSKKVHVSGSQEMDSRGGLWEAVMQKLCKGCKIRIPLAAVATADSY